MENLTSEDPTRIRRARSFRERSGNSGENLRRVRSFKTTPKGLVNRGDSFKIRRSSPQTVQDIEGETLEIQQNAITKLDIPKLDSVNDRPVQCYFRVLIAGAEGVGKSAIIDQLMTSEFLGYENFNYCKFYFFTYS